MSHLQCRRDSFPKKRLKKPTVTILFVQIYTLSKEDSKSLMREAAKYGQHL
jgi:hypothetical protein